MVIWHFKIDRFIYIKANSAILSHKYSIFFVS